jgi:adenylosuccinate lyase
MARIWSDEGKLERWLEVELAALDGWAEIGVVPASGASDSRERRRADARARRGDRGRDAPRRRRVRRRGRERARADGRWFHYGLTSSDVVDTALALQIARPAS